jgi:hypothetical protein
MILIEKNNTRSKRSEWAHIYINTLMPKFKFKNRNGIVITPINCCITLH